MACENGGAFLQCMGVVIDSVVVIPLEYAHFGASFGFDINGALDYFLEVNILLESKDRGSCPYDNIR